MTTTVHPSARQMFGLYSNLQAKCTHLSPGKTSEVSSFNSVQLKLQGLRVMGVVSLSGLNMGFVTFLPGSKHLFISWLQSPFAVILEPLKIKSATVSPSICHEVMGPDAMILVF